LALQTFWEGTDIDYSSGYKVNQDEWNFEEELMLWGSGWLYHPALLDFNARSTIRFTQDRVDYGGAVEDYSRNEDQILGNLTLSFLPKKPYNARAYIGKSRLDVDAPLIPTQQIDTTEYGGDVAFTNFSLGSLSLPIFFNYNHSKTDAGEFFGTDQLRDELRWRTTNDTKWLHTDIEYIILDTQSSRPNEKLPTKRDEQTVKLRQRVDPLENMQLSSSVVFSDRQVKTPDDKFDNDGVTVNERLDWFHTDTLRSNYSYDYTQAKSFGLEYTSHDAEMGVTHQLYESLTSLADVRLDRDKTDFGKQDVLGVDVEFDYTKKIPIGRLDLRLAPSVEDWKITSQQGVLPVVNESHSVVVNVDIDLDMPHAIASTIKVVDSADPSRIYQEGADYDVIEKGAMTAIRVILGSSLDPDVAIPPPSPTVNISYFYEQLQDQSYLKQAFLSEIRFDLWDHLDLRFLRGQTTFDLKEGTEDSFIFSDQTVTEAEVGLRYGGGVSRTAFEYRDVEDANSPRKEYRITQDLNYRPSQMFLLTGYAEYSHLEYLDQGDNADTIRASFRLSTLLPYSIHASGRLAARDTRADRSGDTKEFLGGIELSRVYRNIDYRLDASLKWYDWKPPSGDSSGTSSSNEFNPRIFFRITRNF